VRERGIKIKNKNISEENNLELARSVAKTLKERGGKKK
jgi:hypothetical protein